MNAGKGTRPFIGRNDTKYREGYDLIDWGHSTDGPAEWPDVMSVGPGLGRGETVNTARITPPETHRRGIED